MPFIESNAISTASLSPSPISRERVTRNKDQERNGNGEGERESSREREEERVPSEKSVAVSESGERCFTAKCQQKSGIWRQRVRGVSSECRMGGELLVGGKRPAQTETKKEGSESRAVAYLRCHHYDGGP